MTICDSFKGKVIVVTGCAGQLGLSASRYLHDQGCMVVGIDILADPSFANLCRGKSKIEPAYIQADITDEEALHAVAQQIEKEFGTPTGLVNMAALDAPPVPGLGTNGAVETFDIAEFRRIIDVNLTGSFIVAQAFGSLMAKNGEGSIVFIGSIYGKLSPRQEIYKHLRDDGINFYKPVAYSASKASLSNLSRYLATYWADQNVRVNTLVLGGIYNDQDPRFVDEYQRHVPLARMADVS